MDSYSHERRLIIKFVRKKHSKKWTSLVVDVFSVMFWWVGPIWRVFADFWFVFDFGLQNKIFLVWSGQVPRQKRFYGARRKT